jgi:hypothetical protein
MKAREQDAQNIRSFPYLTCSFPSDTVLSGTEQGAVRDRRGRLDPAGEVRDMDRGRVSRQDLGDAWPAQGAPREVPAIDTFVVDSTHVDAILSVALHGSADFDPRRYPGWDRPDVDGLLGHRQGAVAECCKRLACLSRLISTLPQAA